MIELRPLSEKPSPLYPTRTHRALSAVRKTFAIVGLGVAVACGGSQAEPERVLPPGVPPSATLDDDDGHHHSDEGEGETASGHGAVETGEKEAATVPSRRLEWCEWQPRLSGDRMQARHFVCGESPPAGLDVQNGAPHITDGLLCEGSQPSWARYRFASPTRVRIAFWPQDVRLEVIAPDGTVVARLGRDRPCVTLDAEAGLWTLSANRTPVTNRERRSFEIFFEELGAQP